VLITVFALAATVLTLFQLDPFLAHPWYHLAYWLTGYAVLVATAPAILLAQERAHGGRLPVRSPLSRLARAAGAAAAAATSTAGVALLAGPARFSDVWPWPLAPLTGRLLGVWLCAFAVAHLWALWDGDAARARALYLVAPVTGLLLALVPLAHAGDVRPDAAAELVVYYALAALVALPGLTLLVARAAPAGSGAAMPAAPPGGAPAASSAAPSAPSPAAASGARPMTSGVRAGLLAIAAVIFLLGLSLFVLSSDTDRFFAWTIDVPLTAAFLGASYFGSTTLALACATEREWARGRAFAAPYFIGGVLLLGITFAYIDKFHMGAVTGWAWLLLYAIFPPAVIVFLARQLRTPGDEPARTAPISAAPIAVLAFQAAVMAAWGTALVLAPGEAPSLWPWPLTQLAARAIGVFVLSQAVLALTVCRERDWGRVRPAMLQMTVVGALQLLAMARYTGTLDRDAGAWLYAAFVAGVLLIGAYGTAAHRRRADS
jgi:hypothetical protein